jgi:hypothetical protein
MFPAFKWRLPELSEQIALTQNRCSRFPVPRIYWLLEFIQFLITVISRFISPIPVPD